MEHRKTNNVSEHEFLLFTVNCYLVDGSITPRYICVDRHPSRRIPISFHLGMAVDARDTISIASVPFKNNHATTYSLYKMKFPTHGPYPNMLELTAMLITVTSIAPEYRLYTSACYWYSRMVFEGMAHIFRGVISPADKPQLRGKYAGLVPVVKETGSLLLRDPPAVRAWEQFLLAIEQGGPDVDTQNPRLSPLHKLFDYLFPLNLKAFYHTVPQAENALVRIQ